MDSIAQSVNAGFQMAQQRESQRRQQLLQALQLLQRQAEQQAIAEQRARQAVEFGWKQQEFLDKQTDRARAEGDRANLIQAARPMQTPSSFRPAPTQDPYGLTSGNVQELVPGRLQDSPFVRGLQAPYDQQQAGMISLAAQMGPEALKAIQPFLQKRPDSGKEGTTIESVLVDRVRRGEITLQEAINLKNKPVSDEIKLSNNVEEAMAASIPGFTVDKEVRNDSMRRFGTDKNFSDAILAKAAAIAQSRVAPFYTVMQTDKGLIPFNARGGNVSGSPLTAPQGEPLGRPTPASEMKTGRELSTMGEALKRIDENYSPNYVGVVAGRVGQIKEKLVDLPEKQVMFYSDVNDIKDQLLRARSGAQINEQEYSRLVRFLPTSELPPKNFRARLERFRKEFNDIVTAREKELATGGYKQTSESYRVKSASDYLKKLGR